MIFKHYISFLYLALKANGDAVFTTNAMLTIVAGYLRFPVLLNSPSFVCLFWGKTWMEWNRSLKMEVVKSCYSCKGFRWCNKQTTEDTFPALQRRLKLYPYNSVIHFTYICQLEKEYLLSSSSHSFGTKVSNHHPFV